ncbi:MAG TPA: alpha/beta hydrolase [Thermoleophilaceae bacterium]
MRTLLVALAVTAALAPAAHAATAVDAPTKVVKIGKQKVGYRTFGSGRPLVMVMGLGGTIGSWDPTFLDALAAGGHRIVLLDNEGVGKTTALKGRLTIRRMGETTAALIRRLKLKRPDVAGWSMGGMIAQSLAVRHPKSVRRLVLMATAPGDGKAAAPTPEALKALTGPTTDVNVLLGLLFPPDQTAARDTYVADILMRRPFEGIAPAAQAAKQTAASGAWLFNQDKDGGRVAKLTLPTLIGGGELDPLLPIANQRHLHDMIRGSQLMTYPDAAHAFLFHHQAEFVPLVLQFLT